MSPEGPDMTLEIIIGRTAAYCLHPAAAWPHVSPRGRAAILAAYAAGSYVAVLTGLLLR
jgi:hypothetical protein